MALVLAVGTVSIWNIVGQLHVARATTEEYNVMDRADATSAQVGWLRDSLRGVDANGYRNIQFFLPIQTEVTEIVRALQSVARVDDGDGNEELRLSAAVASHFAAAMQHSASESTALPPGTSADAKVAASELDQVRDTLLAIFKLMPSSARCHVTASADRLGNRLAWSCFWLLITPLVSAAIHVKQFRTLVRPLLWLQEDMRRSAAGEYKDQIQLRGDREFTSCPGPNERLTFRSKTWRF